ncbi:MAG TPA: DEAD/DEAH box helicase [Luteolibacter sp.]|nr:DEAD/DEAH box helicase [Luteolibacter sp.]
MPDSPSASDFIHGDAWQHRFEEEILAASKSLVSKVRELQLELQDDGSAVLRGEVGKEQTELSFWPSGGSWQLETRCSCELGGHCHHAAALIQKAARTKDLGRLEGRGLRGAVAAALEGSAPAAAPVWPRFSAQPRFELHVSRGPLDRNSKLILQSLGQQATDNWIYADAFAIYDAHRMPLRGSRPDWISEVRRSDGSHAVLEHKSAQENEAARQLIDCGLSSLESNSAWQFLINLKTRESGETAHRWFPDPTRIPVDLFWHQFRGEKAARLEALGWSIVIDDQVGHRVHDADPRHWQSRFTPRGGGWFDLSVGFEVQGERHDLLPILAELLESDALADALERPDAGFVYAPLPNGDALRLPVERIRQILGHLESLMNPQFPEKTRVHALDALRLSSELSAETPSGLEELATRLRTPDDLADFVPPPGLQATLRDYQLAGLRWMQWLARHGLHGILADDMGLGKTLQTLGHILAEKEAGRTQGKPALVIAPSSVVPNWQAEAKKFAPGLKVLVLDGPQRHRYHATMPYADLVLTSYALLQRDIEVLEATSFHLVVLDEAQYIKNPEAKVAQAACRLQAECRLCLSGTPVENHLGELWSLMRFLIPGLLGSESTFSEQYRNLKPEDEPARRIAQLKRRVAPLILRRTKDQVAKELPPKTEIVHRIELHTGQKDLYETIRAMMSQRVRQAIAARGGNQYQIVFLDALLKLRQVCCDPRLLPEDLARGVCESAKLDFLTELLEVLIEEGRRILIFSQFTSMLELIEAHLESRKLPYLKLTGASKDRGSLVERFQSGEIPVFLISLKAGGTGLNLTAADTVIHFDPWWNPAAEAQATDRAYRIGQDKPVFVHKLLCQDTVEERIHKLQIDKAKLAADLLSEQDISDRLGPEMMQALLE